ncbi:MAG: zinc dependent phospholipase C family protein [Clostridia bacterium]|nr:zinc dependent phospholipase C family protein [Clostridia bacterium]
MPSTYAHYRFGARLLERLPEAQRGMLMRRRALYDIGQHGPDILFYHHPLKSDPIRRMGSAMHERPGREFFARAVEILRKLEGEERLRAETYVLGFAAHFALDSACHPYVEQRVRETGITHTEIEVEFDRRLMAADGCPERCPIEHIVASEDNAMTIAPFFEGVSPPQIAFALRSMRRYGRLLDTRWPWLRWTIRTVTAKLDSSGELPGWMATGHQPACDETCEGLSERFERGLRLAETLFVEFDAVLSGDGTLNPAYDATFGAE